MTNFIPFARQTIDETDINAVSQALQQNYITRGPTVQAFECAIADRVGASHAVAFSSGSSALNAAYQAAGISSSDKVIASPNSYIATVSGALSHGAKLRLVDIDSYGNMDLNLLDEETVAPFSRGKTFIVPTHFAGVAVEMERLFGMVRTPDVVIIEDGAHALGSHYPDGKLVGSCAYSDMTVFSFHASKNITCGEGGMVTTNDPDLFSRLQKLRDNGIEREASLSRPWYYEVKDLCCNGHMSDIQAALGLSQLKRLEDFCKQKSFLIGLYREMLEKVPGVQLFCGDVDKRTHYHLFEVHIEFELFNTDRTKVMERLFEQEIGSQYHYVPLYAHGAVQPLCRQTKEMFPVMENHLQKALSLPLFSSMQETDVERVVTALRTVLLR